MLREPKMMGISGPASTNQTGLLGHELDVVLVAKPARLRMRQPALIDAVGNGYRLSPAAAPVTKKVGPRISPAMTIRRRRQPRFRALPSWPGMHPRRAAHRPRSGCSWRRGSVAPSSRPRRLKQSPPIQSAIAGTERPMLRPRGLAWPTAKPLTHGDGTAFAGGYRRPPFSRSCRGLPAAPVQRSGRWAP